MTLLVSSNKSGVSGATVRFTHRCAVAYTEDFTALHV
jgi:hypothetical protein